MRRILFSLVLGIAIAMDTSGGSSESSIPTFSTQVYRGNPHRNIRLINPSKLTYQPTKPSEICIGNRQFDNLGHKRLLESSESEHESNPLMRPHRDSSDGSENCVSCETTAETPRASKNIHGGRTWCANCVKKICDCVPLDTSPPDCTGCVNPACVGQCLEEGCKGFVGCLGQICGPEMRGVDLLGQCLGGLCAALCHPDTIGALFGPGGGGR
jgi:hypothetical protein